jgi:hypothetical protein
MPEKVKHGPFRVQLNLTFQGDTYHADSWFIEDEDDIPKLKREILGMIGDQLDGVDSCGAWSIEVTRENL